jgi:hypothetical protein
VCELNAAPGNDIQHIYLFDHVPHRAVLTVPEDATAFPRSHLGTTACMLKWARKSPSNEDAARRAARELTNIVAEAEAQVSGESNIGYGNLGQYYLVFQCFKVVIEELFVEYFQPPSPRFRKPSMGSKFPTIQTAGCCSDLSTAVYSA